MRGIFEYCTIGLFIIIGLAGCASGVERSNDPALSQAAFSESGKQISNVTISLSKDAQAELSDNLKFNQDALLDTVKRALDAKGIVNKDPKAGSLPSIEIVVTNIRTRSNFSAIMFGFMAGDDHIDGDVIVKSSDGRALQKFSVNAAYALGGIAGGQDESRMSWLYEAFAKQTIEALTNSSKD